jgi:hypothetical protein
MLTDAGWVQGKLHVPERSRLLDFFDHAPEFVALTEVQAEGRDAPLPFLAVQRRAVLFLIPPEDELPPEEPLARPTKGQSMACLLRGGWLSGRVRAPLEMRLSDYLGHHPGFVVLYDAHVIVRDPWSQEVVELRAPRLLLNSKVVVGATDPS